MAFMRASCALPGRVVGPHDGSLHLMTSPSAAKEVLVPAFSAFMRHARLKRQVSCDRPHQVGPVSECAVEYGKEVLKI